MTVELLNPDADDDNARFWDIVEGDTIQTGITFKEITSPVPDETPLLYRTAERLWKMQAKPMPSDSETPKLQ